MQYVGYVSFLKGHVVCHSLPPWMIHVIHRTLCGLASHNFTRCVAKASLIPWNASVLTKNVNYRCMTVVLQLCQPRPLPCLPEQALKQIPCSIVSSTWFSYLEGGEKRLMTLESWFDDCLAQHASSVFLTCAMGRCTCSVHFVILCICGAAVWALCRLVCLNRSTSCA